MIETTKAIVFSSLKYAEADLIVTCFTQKSGLKTYLLRGVLNSKKGKLKASYFLPLTQLEIVANHKNKGTLESIREAKVYHTYQTLHTNVVKSSLALFLAEMLKNSIKEEETNIRLFEYIEASLQWLDHHDNIANFHIHFLLKLTEHLGCYPDTSEIELPYFNLAEGQFQNEDISIYSEMSERVDDFKMFFGINFDNSSALKLTKKARLDVLNLVLEYYQLHLHGYKKPKSLAVLNQLFN
ncbi:MAG: DNA repair protein RecO [Patiriisocius sp.]|uniref:DNA repair protein RecO n=1 Tax=Patiriisocius sp. TaxID=2822396 RepID=UPI003EF5AEAA